MSEQNILQQIPNFEDDLVDPFMKNLKLSILEKSTKGETRTPQGDLYGNFLFENTDFEKMTKQDELHTNLRIDLDQPHRARSLSENLDTDEQNNLQGCIPETRKRRKRSQKFSRWGKQEDKKLFDTIYDFEIQGILYLSELLSLPTEDETQYDSIIVELAEMANWRGYLHHLIKRIQTICNSNLDFSVREMKLFKKLMKIQIKRGNIDYYQVLREFPGKTLDFIIKTSKEV